MLNLLITLQNLKVIGIYSLQMWEKFKILKYINDGGMGEIYLAYHNELGAPYAIKKLKKEL